MCKCIKAASSVLCIADGDERLALAEIAPAIDYAKVQIKKIFGSGKLAIRNIENCWTT